MKGAEKKELRRALLVKRRAIGDREKGGLDAMICDRILTHPAFLAATAVLAYLPIKGEIDLSPVIAAAHKRGIPVALPRCTNHEMQFLRVTPETVSESDQFGIPSPPANAPQLVPDENTLCLLPGLAADPAGNRLGYGGGFYDRFLVDFQGVTLFPLYHAFLLPTLPTCPHDRRVQLIITEKGAFSPC